MFNIRFVILLIIRSHTAHTTFIISNFPGYYAYMESSDGRLNDTVSLLTPNINRGMDACLEMAYHMFGNTVGTLQVIRIYDGTPKKEVVFEKSGRAINEYYLG